MSYLIKPEGYKAILSLSQTELGIKVIKEFFQQNLSSELRLRRVTAPLFVLKGKGINDDLNGVERAVTFPIKDLGDAKAEIVHSLAKWKRLTLADYHIEEGYGIYTDMNAIRSDEELDNLHSLYVDQWDWERVMREEDRNIDFLKEIVKRIYAFLESCDFEDALRTAVSLGGDSDTLAAITGSIAEAFYGVPEELRQECRKRLTPELAAILHRWESALYNEKICSRI